MDNSEEWTIVAEMVVHGYIWRLRANGKGCFCSEWLAKDDGQD